MVRRQTRSSLLTVLVGCLLCLSPAVFGSNDPFDATAIKTIVGGNTGSVPAAG